MPISADRDARAENSHRSTDGRRSGRSRLGPTAGDPAWHHLPLLDVLPPQEEYEAWARASYVAEQYLAMMASPPARWPPSWTLVCNPDAYPLVFHCFAGKDRTGILTALVLGLLGVPDADIAEDYALSQAAMHPPARLAAGGGGRAMRLSWSRDPPPSWRPSPLRWLPSCRAFERRTGRSMLTWPRLGHPQAAALLAEVLLEP